MKYFVSATLLLVLIAWATPVAAADFGVRAGRYNEAGEEFAGAEVLFDLGTLSINPNVELSLEEDVTAGSANVDVIVDIARFGAARPFLGAGAGILYADDDVVEARTDFVGNLIGGVAFDLDFLDPYAQVKYFRVLDDDGGDADEIALTIGLRF